jgi:hypothetical protein
MKRSASGNHQNQPSKKKFSVTSVVKAFDFVCFSGDSR